ncbi:hypothetical protein FB451DRAFT_1395511 [Mycena latifolia]|nr:hypothetical protein FB451DRAFT_1395511 [Mycena latifolia]
MLSSKHLPELVKDVTLGTSLPGVVLSVLFLAAVAYLQCNPLSRPHLDRVSFRLLVYALIANVVFGSLMFLDMEETSPGCTLVAFLYGTAPLFSAWIFCCIALNLQLVLIFGVNGNKMEKYYLLGAAILCGACNIPPWVVGKFGWDATTGKCWLRDPSPAVQQRWLIGTRSVPTILMSVIEVFSFVNILIFMLLQVSKIERLRANTSGSAIVTLASTLSKHPILQFRPIIMRIALYPLLSCFLSITVCILSVYTGMHQNPTDFHINLRIFNAFVYSIRPLLYALLAAIDPVRFPTHLASGLSSVLVFPPCGTLTARGAVIAVYAAAKGSEADSNYSFVQVGADTAGGKRQWNK